MPIETQMHGAHTALSFVQTGEPLYQLVVVFPDLLESRCYDMQALHWHGARGSDAYVLPHLPHKEQERAWTIEELPEQSLPVRGSPAAHTALAALPAACTSVQCNGTASQQRGAPRRAAGGLDMRLLVQEQRVEAAIANARRAFLGGCKAGKQVVREQGMSHLRDRKVRRCRGTQLHAHQCVLRAV